MRIAFYAPLKPPGHANPSGDRLLARLLVGALKMAGHDVQIASTLRTFERNGDRAHQQSLREQGQGEARRLLELYRRQPPPDLWFSYHIYHKAPDWTGPAVSKALDIPYLVAEASVSPSQSTGSWRQGHQQAIECIQTADAMVALNTRDLECAAPYLNPKARLLRHPPFLDIAAIQCGNEYRQGTPKVTRLISVAMMRPGDKQRSWLQLAKIIDRLAARNWRLDVVGDGKSAETIEAHLQKVCGDRVRFHGRLEGEKLYKLLKQSDIFVWPAMNEAFGMALLEAQSAGLAIVAGREGGVPGIVYNGLSGLLYAEQDPDTAATMLDYLLKRPAVVRRMGSCARALMLKNHSIESAAIQLDQLIRTLCAR